MKNITLSADDQLIEAARARARARAEHSTLNEKFRAWLAFYAGTPDRLRRYEETMALVRGKVVIGAKLNRDEMNER